jgi:hypothetical protein
MAMRLAVGHLDGLPCTHALFHAVAGEDLSCRFVTTIQSEPALQAWTPELSVIASDDGWRQIIQLTDAADASIVFHQCVFRPICHLESMRILPSQSRRKGWGKCFFRQLLNWYDHYGISQLVLTAAGEDGGYWWARAGFLPDATSWQVLERKIQSYVDRFPNISSIQDIGELLRSGPKQLRVIAASEHGRSILRGTMWQGSLDLTDIRRYSIFRAWVHT